MQIAVDDDVQGVAREPVSPAAPGCVRLCGAGQSLAGLDASPGPLRSPYFGPAGTPGHIEHDSFEVVAIAEH